MSKIAHCVVSLASVGFISPPGRSLSSLRSIQFRNVAACFAAVDVHCRMIDRSIWRGGRALAVSCGVLTRFAPRAADKAKRPAIQPDNAADLTAAAQCSSAVAVAAAATPAA